ncbi:hypothetical protein G6F68_010356 [Rhizopus microsporus]|nr:hypothetical protein G6F68_010356 [Rhizopus microsporus]
MADAVDIAQQLVGFKEDAVTEVVRLDARLRQRVQRVIGGYGVHIVLQGGGVVLPAQPRLCRFDAGGFIGAVQARPVGGDHVGALAFWNIGLVAVPAFGEDPARTAAGLCEPAVLDLAAEEHAAHDQAGRTRGMGLRIGQRQRRAPRAAVDQPAFDAQMLTHLLDVGHQRLRGVVAQLAERRGAPAAALVDQHDAVARRVEEAAMGR